MWVIDGRGVAHANLYLSYCFAVLTVCNCSLICKTHCSLWMKSGIRLLECIEVYYMCWYYNFVVRLHYGGSLDFAFRCVPEEQGLCLGSMVMESNVCAGSTECWNVLFLQGVWTESVNNRRSFPVKGRYVINRLSVAGTSSHYRTLPISDRIRSAWEWRINLSQDAWEFMTF